MAATTPRRGLLSWLSPFRQGVPPDSPSSFHEELPEKVGAGVLLTCMETGDVLLLLRRSTNNDRTWGLPGGNVEVTDDGDLRRTAIREAEEEIGPLPPHRVGRSFLTRRGKRGQKYYTVFLCELQAAEREAFTPRLNIEHREWRWFAPGALRAALMGGPEPPAPLHPVVEALIRQHPSALQQPVPA